VQSSRRSEVAEKVTFTVHSEYENPLWDVRVIGVFDSGLIP